MRARSRIRVSLAASSFRNPLREIVEHGRRFALELCVMTGPYCVGLCRRKAVWGPKRTLAATALLLLAFAPNAIAGGVHARAAHKAAPGRPNSIVKPYKLDGELAVRA